MNYETATKFELNKRLAEIIDFGERWVSFNEDNQSVYIVEKDGLFDTLPVGYFDPCKNWSDIMPIAVELGVSLEPDADSVRGWWFAASRDTSMHSRNENGNPQRALVICCIKVLEAQANEKK